MVKNIHYFGESTFYSTCEEEKEARKYLEYWKKNLIKKINRDTFSAKIVNEQFIVRDPIFMGYLCTHYGLSLKLTIEIEFRFEESSFSSYLGPNTL